MPQNLTPEILEATGGPIAAGLLPAWRVTWVLLSQEEIDALDPDLPGPNLAVVKSLPERRMATAHVVNPFPDGESLSETLHHELGHSWISPFTSQLPATQASVMLEEQLVETLGVYLASLAPPAAATARRALARVVDRYAPPPALRARVAAKISASAPTAARGGSMDGKQVLAAIAGQDEAAALKILNDWAAEQLAAAGHPGSAEPDGDEAAAMPAAGGDPAAMPQKPPAGPPAAAKPGAPPPPPPGTPADDAARTAARLVDDLKRMHSAQLPGAKEGIVLRARARGFNLTPAIEKRIMAAPTFEAAEGVLAIVEEAGGGTTTRGRSGVEHIAGPDAAEATPKGEADDKLISEGFPAEWIGRYRARLKEAGAEAGAEMLTRGREVKASNKARLARDLARTGKAVAS